MYGMGQGPSISALAQQQQQVANPPFVQAPVQSPQHNLFIGSISGGITDQFLTDLLGVSTSSVAVM